MPGGGELRSGADHRQHPAAGADHLAVRVQAGAGVDDHGAVRGALLQTTDHPPGHRGRRVVLRGQHHRHRRTLRPLQRRVLGQRPGRRGVQQATEGGLQPGQQRLGLGITEPGVELDHPHPPTGEGQTGVEQTAEGSAAAGQLVHRGLQHGAEHLVDQAVGGPRQRRVRAHPAGVGAGVVVVRALEVLGGLQRDDGGAVGDGEQAHLGTVEVLLDHHPATGRGVVESLLAVGGDHDTLARGQSVVLDHVRRPELVQRGRRLLGGQAEPGRCGGHPRRSHHVLGEGLAALQLGRRPRRPEAGDPRGAHRVGHPRHQRGLRADHDQVDPELGGQRGDRLRVVGDHRVVGPDRGRPRVARCRVHLDHARITGQGEREGVLPTPRPDDEDAKTTGGIGGLERVGRRHPRSLPSGRPVPAHCDHLGHLTRVRSRLQTTSHELVHSQGGSWPTSVVAHCWASPESGRWASPHPGHV